ncbi:alpha/beta hydrolase [Chryseolinea sp. H1M3-3]|uniref:alpha/beta fold hydrolase n=1 Tax=Chryseolinea sp. H1M3-3 TaxID=3034144 RepID=UPI0023ECC392|nr:alpha/beta hydrolase [Chryseolinea sp. H1M3-3]
MKNIITKSIGAGLNTLAHIAPAKTAQLGFELFCRPIRVPINEKQQAFFNSATKESFTYNGNHIQTYRWGTGEKVIMLLHGWQSHSYRWKIYIEALSKDHTVYTLDAPGHGLSGGKMLNVPLYSEVIREQIKRIGSVDTIITHSLGGFATFYAFYRNPELSVNKIVALASPGEAQEFFDYFTSALRLSKKSTQLIVEYFEKTFKVSPAFFSAPVFASTLKVPGLIIHDEHDNETPFHHAERIHRAWKNSKLIKTKGFGHNLKSTDVVKEVVHFVNDPLSLRFNTEMSISNQR